MMNREVYTKIREANGYKSSFLDLSGLGLTYFKVDSRKLTNIKHIDLSNNQISDLSDSIDALKKVHSINLSNNKLSNLPDNIGKLSQLDDLNLSNNQFSNLPDNINQLSELTTLDLSNNQLSSLPDSIGQLIRLENFNVSDNQLTYLPKSIGRLEEISELNLSSNQLSSLPSSIIRLSELTDLNISNNQFNSLSDVIGQLISLNNLDLSHNQLINLPDDISQLNNLDYLNLSNNRLIILPDNIGQLSKLTNIDLDNNQLDHLPDSIGNLSMLKYLYLDNNNLSSLPTNFSQLTELGFLSIRNNKFDVQPEEFVRLENASITLDFRGNPFLNKALLRSQYFTKIWCNTPSHLREILKIYFSGFNVFYSQRTQKQLEFNVINESDGLIFEIIPNKDTDPEQVELLLNEYYNILKIKLQEGANTGTIFPKASDDPANLFAQIQASNFAQNASYIRHSLKGHISDHDVFIGISGSLESMETEFHRALSINKMLNFKLLAKATALARLEGETGAQQKELYHRRIEAQTWVNSPINISVSQQVHIKQQIGDDFDKLRARLYPYQKDYQRSEGADIQKELDKISEKPTLTQEEKNSLSKRIKRWVDGAKEAVTVGKEAGEVWADLTEYGDKLKKFAETVLTDPQLIDAIESIKQAVQGAL